MGGVRECGGELGTGYGVGESEGGGTVGLVKRGGKTQCQHSTQERCSFSF